MALNDILLSLSLSLSLSLFLYFRSHLLRFPPACRWLPVARLERCRDRQGPSGPIRDISPSSCSPLNRTRCSSFGKLKKQGRSQDAAPPLEGALHARALKAVAPENAAVTLEGQATALQLDLPVMGGEGDVEKALLKVDLVNLLGWKYFVQNLSLEGESMMLKVQIMFVLDFDVGLRIIDEFVLLEGRADLRGSAHRVSRPMNSPRNRGFGETLVSKYCGLTCSGAPG